MLRTRIVLAAPDGVGNGVIARHLAVSVNTARKWRDRFAERGLDGLTVAAHPRRHVRWPPPHASLLSTRSNSPSPLWPSPSRGTATSPAGMN